MKDQFKIPGMLMEREKKMKEQYDSREDVDATQLGFSSDEINEMKHIDFMYGGKTTQEELEDLEKEKDISTVDPYHT